MSTIGSRTSFSNDSSPSSSGSDLLGSMVVELKTADKREIRTNDFIKEWKKNIINEPGLDNLTIRAPSGGPPGRDLDVRFQGDDLKTLKLASNELINIARNIPGVSSLSDNLEFGIQEKSLSLNEKGQSLGFSITNIGEQVRSAINGTIISEFPKGDEEVKVRLKLSEDEQNTDMINELRIISPLGESFRLQEIAIINETLPFASINRTDGFREVTISGDLFTEMMNTAQARNFLMGNGLPEIAKKYNVSYRFDGKDLEQKETFADMGTGSIIGLLLIYFILAWVFKSWSRPFSIMIMIPFAFALLALAGIVVNNSIILVSTIERRLEDLRNQNDREYNDDKIINEAIINGVVDRFRPVLLTSLTTIGGLSALMF